MALLVLLISGGLPIPQWDLQVNMFRECSLQSVFSAQDDPTKLQPNQTLTEIAIKQPPFQVAIGFLKFLVNCLKSLFPSPFTSLLKTQTPFHYGGEGHIAEVSYLTTAMLLWNCTQKCTLFIRYNQQSLLQ